MPLTRSLPLAVLTHRLNAWARKGYFAGMISQALAGVEVAGQTLALCSPITTNPRGIKNPLQTVSFAAGSFTLQALVD